MDISEHIIIFLQEDWGNNITQEDFVFILQWKPEDIFHLFFFCLRILFLLLEQLAWLLNQFVSLDYIVS